MEEAHDKNTVSLGDISQPLADHPDDLRAAEVDPVFPDGTNNSESLRGAKETDGATTSQNEALEAESVAIADKETLTPLKTEDNDDRDGEYLTVLELDEEPNIYIELKGEED